ncbi:MAG: mechanosensitive ion channel family protein [Deltaproteobacteria bacterium]|nr:MAG: mechanosensitive ion channel family protein [Deltaproteobacteria bacterium]
MQQPEAISFVSLFDPSGVPYALLVIVITWLAIRFVTRSLDALAERFTQRRLLFKQLTAITRFVIIIVSSVTVAGAVVNFTRESLLALGGSIAVAVGFAFKDLLASLMAGLILLFDRPFQVGDRVEFGGTYGEVKEIGLRAVRINTLDDNLVSVPNNLFLSGAVACANAGALDQMCVFDFWIGCNEDFETAKQLVYEATASSRYVYLAKPITLIVREEPVRNGGERFAIRITVKAYVFDGRYEVAFGTDVTERVKRAFRAARIRTAGELEWTARQAAEMLLHPAGAGA